MCIRDREQATEYDAAGNALPNDSPVLTNVAGVAFQEQQAGYLAGYAAVKDGFTKLGFSGGGGGTNPACCRFGYGYVQGANAAALEKGITVDMNYSWQYGSNFSASTDLQTMINGWYVNGTEIVFACGGSMFQSIVAAASANDGYVIGVDVDQSGESEYVVTSAMKGLADAVQWAVAKVYDGTFDTIGGQQASLGVADNAVQLPTGADSWRFETFTVEEYESQMCIRDSIVTGLEKYLEEYRRARNVQSEVMAVNRFVGTFYAHCGNRRLDANMISIQGQQLLLRYIYADCLTERGSHAEDFEGMLEAARRGDAEEVCICLQRNTDRCIPVLMEYVLKEKAAR